MHEAGVTQRLLDVVSERAAGAGAVAVTDVYLEVGEEAGVDIDAIDLHWPLLTRGTVADGARLHYDTVPEPFAFRVASIEVSQT